MGESPQSKQRTTPLSTSFGRHPTPRSVRLTTRARSGNRGGVGSAALLAPPPSPPCLFSPLGPPPTDAVEAAAPHLSELNDIPIDHFAMRFMRCLAEDTAERELGFRFRASMAKVNAPLASMRREGLSEALQQLQMIVVAASVEAKGGGTAPSRTAGRGGGHIPLTPFDAIMASSLSAVSTLTPPQSVTWDRAQRALHRTDYSSALFHRVLVPSAEVRTRMLRGLPVAVDLSEAEALAWTTILATSQTPGGAGRTPCQRSGFAQQQQQEGQGGLYAPRGGDYCGLGRGYQPQDVVSAPPADPDASAVPPPPLSIQSMLTHVTYDEQELALRVLQGLCLVCYHQRRCIAESCLLHFATEVFQCFQQHAQALYQQLRRMHLKADMPSHAVTNTSGLCAGDSAGVHRSDSALHLGPTSLLQPAPRSTNRISTKPSHTGSVGRSTGGRTAGRTVDGPVEIAEGLVRVVVALIDAVEAACHYNPSALTRIVQSGGVKALLSLVYTPCVPISVRASALDTVSVLMQEVEPFRRPGVCGVTPRPHNVNTTADGGVNGPGGGATGPHTGNPEDAAAAGLLLQDMVMQSVTGSFGSKVPPPYLMDRASASKFDSAVREWLSHNGLSYVAAGIMRLRDVKDFVAVPHVPKGEMQRLQQRGNQLRLKNITNLLQVIDGKSAELKGS